MDYSEQEVDALAAIVKLIHPLDIRAKQRLRARLDKAFPEWLPGVELVNAEIVIEPAALLNSIVSVKPVWEAMYLACAYLEKATGRQFFRPKEINEILRRRNLPDIQTNSVIPALNRNLMTQQKVGLKYEYGLSDVGRKHLEKYVLHKKEE
jgi:hypothetical protein